MFMSNGKRIGRLAAAVVTAAWGGMAWGQAAPRTPLMDVLDRVGVAPTLDQLHLKIYGYGEGSYTYSASSPPADKITGRFFDFEQEDTTLNQIDLTIERAVDYKKASFDIGGRMEWIYGGDARLIHSNGLFDYYGLPTAPGATAHGNGPQEQFDLNQFYVDLALPVGTGLRVRAGKFVSLQGYETINPTTTPLYSRGFLFTYLQPKTLTGVYGTYDITPSVTLDLGISRGWEQSLEDNNGAIDGFGRVGVHSLDNKVNVWLTAQAGPELTGDNGHYRTLIDLVAEYDVTDQVTLALNGDYYYGSSESPISGDGANDYGLAGFVTWRLSDYVAVNGRLEWFDDSENARGLDTVVYDASLGLLITPFPTDPYGSNLKLRPELRFDYADKATWDAGTDHYQFTAALEAYFTF